MAVDGAGKVHHVATIARPVWRQNEHLVGNLLAGAIRDALRANEVHIQRQVRPVLLDGAADYDAELAHLDGLVDLGPGEFLVTVLYGGTAGHAMISLIGIPWSISRRLRPGTSSLRESRPS